MSEEEWLPIREARAKQVGFKPGTQRVTKEMWEKYGGRGKKKREDSDSTTEPDAGVVV